MEIANNFRYVGIANTKQINKTNVTPIRKTSYGDTVSFASRNTEFKYADSWYLKDKQIVEQDDFTTTIIDNSYQRSIIDKLRGKQYYKKIYDLPLRLREDLKKENTDTVVQNIPSEILENTELSNQEFIKEIDKINSTLNLVAPKYDLYEDKTKQEFQIKLGKKVAIIQRLTQGMSGSIYKIEVDGCKPLALKHYLNPQNINCTEGAFAEIAFAKKANEDNVSDIPLLYSANPYNGWMLSDFIDENYEERKNGIKFSEYYNKNKLTCLDINSGMAVKGKNVPIFVDFGYIQPVKSSVINYRNVILNDNIERTNSTEYLNSNTISDLSKIENIVLYGNNSTIEKVNKLLPKNSEMRFFIDTEAAVNFVLSDKEIPEDMQERLQKEYNEIGYIGDACELIKSCNQ